eukprot:TRINITY_DN7405_c0_g1_i4.p1 TRINITY_DN7405_c0_g1~~TRINITY_DN7405_c0_g1_i4.p1  ORF type:complete len:257 (+),score=43.07 TRINITY_DN7405_c0_g1_i4:143-913(+)
MACGMSSGLSARCRERLRQQQLSMSDEEEDGLSPVQSMSSVQSTRIQKSHQPTLQTVPIGDPAGVFLGVPKWPRALGWRVTNSPRQFTVGPGPQPQEPDSPLPPMSIEEEALCGSGPLSTLNLVRPRRYGITHPARYGEVDREGMWKKTMLENSMGAEKRLRQRLGQLRFPRLDLLQPARRPQPPGGHSGGPRCRNQRARDRAAERRNVVLPRTIRSNVIVDAQNRKIFAPRITADAEQQECSTSLPPDFGRSSDA